MVPGTWRARRNCFALQSGLGDTRRVRDPLLIIAAVLAFGCASAPPPPRVSLAPPPPVRHAERPEAPQDQALPPPAGALWREQLLHAVDSGLGRFLQHVEVQPKLEDGTFRGFQIVNLTPDEFWGGVDIQKGDVVTAINGMPIERETQAYAAFQALKQAKELIVSYQRAGEPRELKYRILAQSEGGKSTSAPSRH